jgi:hypothetical protein
LVVDTGTLRMLRKNYKFGKPSAGHPYTRYLLEL